MPLRHRFSEEAGPAEAHLRLVAFSDLHMRLAPYDYIADRTLSGQSLALAAQEADLARQEADNALTFDVGDAYEGSPVDSTLLDPATAAEHPMALALRAAGVDAATLGNHDFNHGLPGLEAAVACSAPPTVLANLVRRRGASPLEDTPFLPPVMVLERDLLCGDGVRRKARIGLIGVVPPQTLDWDRERLGDAIVARDIVETVAAWAPELRRQGADLVVVLCHSGIGSAQATPMMENAAVPVAALPEVDVVLAGHAHGAFPEPGFSVAPDAKDVVDPVVGRVHGKPVVMPGFWGNRIGLVDLRLSAGDAGWHVTDSAASLREIAVTTPHPAVAAAVDPHHAAVLRATGRTVAQCPVRLHTYFAQVADSAAVQVVNAAQASHAATCLAGHPEAGLPLLSAAAPLKAGGRQGPEHYTDVPAGALSLRHMVDLHVYQNTLAALCVTGAELRDWLERSASAFFRVPTGARDAPLLDPDHPGYAFDVVSGVTYRIDLSQPARFGASGEHLGDTGRQGPGRIVALSHRGMPVQDSDAFVLVTNSYRLGHGNGYPIPNRAPISLGPPTAVRDILTAYLAKREGPPLEAQPGWGFVAHPDTTAVFETGPGAATAPLPGADAPEGPALALIGPGARGALRFRLDLSKAAALGPR